MTYPLPSQYLVRTILAMELLLILKIIMKGVLLFCN